VTVVAVQKIQRVANLWWTTDLMPPAAMLNASQGGFLAASSCIVLASFFAASFFLPACIYAVGLALSLLAIILPQCGRLHTLAARRICGRSWCQFCVAVLIASAPIATQAAESVIDIHTTSASAPSRCIYHAPSQIDLNSPFCSCHTVRDRTLEA